MEFDFDKRQALFYPLSSPQLQHQIYPDKQEINATRCLQPFSVENWKLGIRESTMIIKFQSSP